MKLAEGLQLTGEGQDTHIFLANALHAADLGSTAKPSETYYRWMQAVFEEFFAQGDKQKELGLEVTPRPTSQRPAGRPKLASPRAYVLILMRQPHSLYR